MMTLEELQRGIAGNRFIVVGRVGMDLSPTPANTKTEDAETMMVAVGGSSANTAIGIVKFGGNADLLTRVSDDAVGRYCVKQLEKYHVGTQYVTPIGGEFRNSLAVYETRIEEHQSVIYRNGAADFQMSIEDVEAVDYAQYSALVTAGTVFAAEPSRTGAFRAFQLAKEAGVPIIFDVDYRPYSWPSAQVAEDVLSRAAEQSDMIVANDEEFGFVAGGLEHGLQKARELAQNTCALVVYKMGPKGAITFAGGEEIATGIFPVDAIKPTGAGDSFMAGFLSSFAESHDVKRAVLRGSACASIVVAQAGCAPAMPDTEQLETFLLEHPGPTEPDAEGLRA
jgi:5-dehydro-2-deoxygluconokinase